MCRYLKQQELISGRTGRLAFDSAGDRKFVKYEILNVQSVTGPRKVVGTHSNEVGLSLPVQNKDPLKMDDDDTVVWPGNTTKKPEGFKKNRELKVFINLLNRIWWSP